MHSNHLASLGEVSADEWNALDIGDDPFLRHEYLNGLELSGCAGPGTRWQPHHVTLRDADGRLVGAMPLYEKTDSWGEYVFDFAWAQAYAQHGFDYYPKLVCALPYTPVGGRRLLVAPGAGSDVRAALIDAAVARAEARGASSLHALFVHADERTAFESRGLLIRQDCQFHWFNDGYRDFDDYLATFRSARRKKMRRERRFVHEAGIRFRTLRGSQLSADDWQTFYRFYASSFLVRGRHPYFPADLFPRLATGLGDRMIIKFARRDGEPIAAALFFESAQRLYGRYWGCSEFHNALHFETCYHQGIEYCIEHGIEQFDPGTQGEHKIARGFRAEASWSAHWIAHPGFRAGIADYLERERAGVQDYMIEVDAHLPFRSPSGDDVT